MNIDDADLIPVGGGSLRRPLAEPAREPVARFSITRNVDPGEIWQPHRPTDTTRGASQGDPFNVRAMRPGHPLEHEPVTRNERDAEHVTQAAAHVVASQQVRAALRGGVA